MKTKWIDAENPPKETGLYNVVIDQEIHAVVSLWWNGKHWCFDNMLSEGEPTFTAGFGVDILFWQPLPEPPKV